LLVLFAYKVFKILDCADVIISLSTEVGANMEHKRICWSRTQS